MDKRLSLVNEWVKKAGHDLGMAKLALDHHAEFTDLICYHCQQAVEKFLKACLIFWGIEFRKTHSLTYLLDLFPVSINVSDELFSKAVTLEGYAVEIRYPDEGFLPNWDETEVAYQIGLTFQTFCSSILNKDRK